MILKRDMMKGATFIWSVVNGKNDSSIILTSVDDLDVLIIY